MTQNHTTSVADPELERQGRRVAAPSIPLLVVAAALFVPGVILVIAASSWGWILGIVLIVLSFPVAAIAIGTWLAGAVSRWSARHRSFA